MTDGHHYDSGFFDYIDSGAQRSAAALVPLVARALAPATVLDVGCGRGVWVRQWTALGVDATGVDGAYVAADLVVPRENFRAVDLSEPFALDRRFDLVQCLEVAEHLPQNAAATLIASLAAHGDIVVFSAAVPGQGGEHHVNERPKEYWRDLFRRHGYRAFDLVRPLIAGDRRIEPWYRYNTLVFAAETAMPRLAPQILVTALGPAQAIPELAPLGWRARNAIVRRLPPAAVATLVGLKHATWRLRGRTAR